MPKSLTARSVESEKPGPSRREIPDGLLPGLYLVVQPSGAKSWAVRYRHKGKPRKLTLGPLAPVLDGPEPPPKLGSPLTLAGARALARDALRNVAAGEDPSIARRDDRAAKREGRDLFETVAIQFIERHAKRKNRSWKETARLLGFKEVDGALVRSGSGVAAKWSGRRIQDIGKRDVLDYLDGIVDGGAGVVANRSLAAIRKMFNWSIRRDILESNPCANLDAPTAEEARDRFLDDGELARVWGAAGTLGFPFGPLIRIMILTGAREGEVAKMRWSDLDLAGAVWRRPGDRQKNDDPHDIPLTPAVVEIIEALPRIGRELVFTTTGRTPVSGFSRAKERLDKAIVLQNETQSAPLAHWRLHDIRRTVTTGMARIGIDLHVAEKVIAHKSGSFRGIVGVYQRHSFADEKRAALLAWADHVARLVGDEPAKVVPLRGAAS